MHIEASWVIDTLMENSSDSIYIKDRDCRLRQISRKMALDLGVSDPSELYGKTDSELYGEDFGRQTCADDSQVMETGQPKYGYVEKYVTPSGRINWTSTSKLPLKNSQGEVIGLLGITREINELKKSEIEFQWLATHDPLTSLANRYLLIDRIDQAIYHSQRCEYPFALLMIDLNDFKKINDSAGHSKGDEYLQRVAEVLTANLRPSDTVARIGGDEFVILLDEILNEEDVKNVVRIITDIIKYQVDPQTNSVTAAIGYSLFPRDGQDTKTLLDVADKAMYKNKRMEN